MQRLCTVVAGTQTYAFASDDLGEVMRVYAVDRETDASADFVIRDS